LKAVIVVADVSGIAAVLDAATPSEMYRVRLPVGYSGYTGDKPRASRAVN